MPMRANMTKKLFSYVLLVALFTQSAQPWQSQWRHYKNERWGFCLTYPQNWEIDEGTNKAGIAVSPPQDRPSGFLSQISVGALLAGKQNGRTLTVEENLAAEDDFLRENGASELATLDKHSVTVKGHKALARTITYTEKGGG